MPSHHQYRNRDLDWHPAWPRLHGPTPPDSYASNGANWAPDVLFGCDLRPAAHLHDWHYGGNVGGRIQREWFRYTPGREPYRGPKFWLRLLVGRYIQ